ncbi:NitT/TauT family transport system ATP-binding protein [Anoxybacillus tepidamans]|uniref:NitT/TauT family transport system ATP-binding protein n=1 Tax=Anoxybacteroides tepidamans TaxID=265948 RepID=A0A7W8IPA4_9BACL|nr:ABC transporter ATP-binding protein [Anoxybacillus tepidamans]MBB5324139.1 NitT/TauT family transport system ATP-binding protein [Anoxybacillus tepidamans]
MTNQSPIISVNKITKTFFNRGQPQKILDQISFDVQRGELISILGKSGCGKSTLLNLIGGFDLEKEGEILLDGQVVNQPSRRCVMLMQNYGLLPWRSVLKNVELPLENTGMSKKEIRERAKYYLHMVGLGDKLDAFPKELSGGMQQRVAIARAFVIQPEVILMDEPFAALDAFTRYYLQDELIKIQEKENTTILLVTHDIDEAIYLSNRIFMLSANPGRIYQELKIPSSRPRDRSSLQFQKYREIIFRNFHFNHPIAPIELNV